MASTWWLPFLLFSVTSAELFSDPVVERGRALGVGPTAKNAIHRERLALYNLLDSPNQGYIQNSEAHPISQYIPIQMELQKQDVASLNKDIPFVPAVYTPGLQLLPPKPIRAPYASAEYFPPVNHQQLYPYPPIAVYAPTYPYVYKSLIPEEVSQS